MSYTHYRSLTVSASAIPTNQTNFPAVLDVTDTDFRTVEYNGEIHNTVSTGGASGTLTVPADFVICTDYENPNTTKVDFEFTYYEPTTGHVQVWIEIPALDFENGAVLYVCYTDSSVTTNQENVAGTWANGFAGVWHLNEESGTVAYDSLGNNNGTYKGNLPNPYEFDLSTGQHPDGSTGWVELPDFINVGGSSGDYTISFWGILDSHPGSNMHFWNDTDGNSQILAGYVYVPSYPMVYPAEYAWGMTLNNGNWWVPYSVENDPLSTVYQITITHNSNDLEMYVDGSSVGSRNDPVLDGTGFSLFGENGNFNGKGNEVLISNVTRTDDWVAITYTNQANPSPDGSFWTLSEDLSFDTWKFWSEVWSGIVYPYVIADSKIVLIGRPTWVSPENTASVSSQPSLTFTMPNAQGNMHFFLELDTTQTLDSENRIERKTHLSQTGWEYWDGSQWQPFPAGGVPDTYSGNQCRYNVQPNELSEGVWYRKVRGGIAKT